MKTIELEIPVNGDAQEYLVAELADLGFEGFVQEDACLKAYIEARLWDGTKRDWIEQWLVGQGVEEPMTEHVIDAQNWNARWEETVQPVAVPPFIIKPTWADLPPEHEDKILLEVDPKMSFGTGYHESTRLMLRLMPDVVKEGDSVLDAGTGTGILAIAAARLGARRAVGFDFDEWSYPNATENVLLNGFADRIDIIEGYLEDVPPETFDVILANINLNALLGLLGSFHQRLVPHGHLVMAGMLIGDRERMSEALISAGFEITSERTENDWWAVVAGKTT